MIAWGATLRRCWVHPAGRGQAPCARAVAMQHWAGLEYIAMRQGLAPCERHGTALWCAAPCGSLRMAWMSASKKVVTCRGAADHCSAVRCCRVQVGQPDNGCAQRTDPPERPQQLTIHQALPPACSCDGVVCDRRGKRRRVRQPASRPLPTHLQGAGTRCWVGSMPSVVQGHTQVHRQAAQQATGLAGHQQKQAQPAMQQLPTSCRRPDLAHVS